MYEIKSAYEEAEYFQRLEQELVGFITGEKNLIANLANIASWIFHSCPDLNWCGFYLWDDEDQELVLGPFQGKPACIRIKPERGVCGGSYTKKKTLRVDDVHAFAGHIACDAASSSELVVPLMKDGKCFGVLDLDSPLKNRFTHRDEVGFTKIMDLISPRIFN